MNKLTALITLLILCSGCSQYPSSLAEYRVWFAQPDNGFVHERNVGQLSYKVQLRPAELMMLSQLQKEQDLSKEEIAKLKASYSNSTYFLLTIAPQQEESPNQGDLLKSFSHNQESYMAIVKELAFHIPEQVELITENDTLTPLIHHYEQGYELRSQQRFLFAFPKTMNQEELTFIYNDNVFGAGRLKFKFQSNSIPELPLSNKL